MNKQIKKQKVKSLENIEGDSEQQGLLGVWKTNDGEFIVAYENMGYNRLTALKFYSMYSHLLY